MSAHTTSGVREFRYDRSEVDALSTAVVAAVAEVEGVDPTALSPSLYSFVDPDALDEVFAGRSEGRLVLNAWGHRIAVYADCRIEIVDV